MVLSPHEMSIFASLLALLLPEPPPVAPRDLLSVEAVLFMIAEASTFAELDQALHRAPELSAAEWAECQRAAGRRLSELQSPAMAA